MKIRTGFVSNSSSSSFIVIAEHNINVPTMFEGQVLRVDGRQGQTEFGWEQEVYNDMWSRINFCYLQAHILDRGKDSKDYHYMDKLVYVLKENLKCTEVEFTLDGYIDHQSSAIDGENIEMFNSNKDLYNFIFSDSSEIHTDNDNH